MADTVEINVSYSVGRKVNLGNYESADVHLSESVRVNVEGDDEDGTIALAEHARAEIADRLNAEIQRRADALKGVEPAAGVPEGYRMLEDAAATKAQVEAFMLLFARKAGQPDTTMAAEWLAEHAGKTHRGAVSVWWLGEKALALLVKPDPSTPELPAEPAARPQDEPREANGEALPPPNPDDEIPF